MYLLRNWCTKCHCVFSTWEGVYLLNEPEDLPETMLPIGLREESTMENKVLSPES